MAWTTYEGLALPGCVQCCGSCWTSCRSKTATETLPACEESETGWSCEIEYDSGPPPVGIGTITINIVLGPVEDNGDGTWKYVVTTLSATATDGTVDDVYIPEVFSCSYPDAPGIREGGNLNFEYCTNIGIGSLCVIWDGGSSSVMLDPSWCAGADPAFAPGFQYWFVPLYAAELEYPELPYDDPAVCIGTISAPTPLTGSYSFTLFEFQAIFVGLTIGACYEAVIYLEWRQTESDEWEVYEDISIDFEAEAEREVSDWLGPYPDFDAPPPTETPGYQVRVGECQIREVEC